MGAAIVPADSKLWTCAKCDMRCEVGRSICCYACRNGQGHDSSCFGYQMCMKCKAIFQQYDANRNGKLSLDEFTGIAKKLVPNANEKEVTLLFRCVDRDSNGDIDTDEFFDWLYGLEVKRKR
mmetsp:Transcript_87658/g.246228  ORF Transcript_87658/g.246228 Transcript_87658/m.246228 type:complete len:122 (-) Transcript_87658:262-627(-)